MQDISMNEILDLKPAWSKVEYLRQTPRKFGCIIDITRLLALGPHLSFMETDMRNMPHLMRS